jgi:hypothetical protein
VRVSPYRRGALRPAKYLFGRSEQLDLINRSALEVQVNKCSDVQAFLAPVGLGKTCLLKHTRRLLQQRGWLCGYSEASTDAATAIADLLSDASDALPPGGLGGRFRARLEQFNITAGPVGIGLKLGETGDLTPYTRLSRLIASLGQLASQADVGVALLIDEAHVLSRQDLELILRVVNRLDELPIALFLAGLPSIPRRFVSGDDDDDRRTMPEVWYSDLKPLSWNESELALSTPVIDAGYAFETEAVSILIAFSAGHPLALQMLGSASWLEADRDIGDGRPLLITRKHALSAVSSVRSQLTRSVYEPIWETSTELTKRVLRKMAQSEKTKLASFDSLAEHDTAAKLFANGVVYNVGASIRSPDFQLVMPGFDSFIRGVP